MKFLILAFVLYPFRDVQAFGPPRWIEEAAENLVHDLSECDMVFIGSLVEDNGKTVNKEQLFKRKDALFYKINVDLILASRLPEPIMESMVSKEPHGKEMLKLYIVGSPIDTGRDIIYLNTDLSFFDTKYLFFVKRIDDKLIGNGNPLSEKSLFLDYGFSKPSPFQLEWSKKFIYSRKDRSYRVATTKHNLLEDKLKRYFRNDEPLNCLTFLHLIISSINKNDDVDHFPHLSKKQRVLAKATKEKYRNLGIKEFHYVCNLKEIVKISSTLKTKPVDLSEGD